jgi:hypothetical protein
MHHYSPASLFGPFLITVFGVHLFLTEIAALILKTTVIE